MRYATPMLPDYAISEIPAFYKAKVGPYLQRRFDFGPSFYFVYHYQQPAYVFIESRVENILQYTPQEIRAGSGNFFLKHMHPDDLLQHEKAMAHWQQFYFNLSPEDRKYYSTSFDFRLRKKDGRYLRLLQQLVFIEYDTEGNPLYSLEKCTSINHWQKGNEMVLSVIGPQAGKNLIYYPSKELKAGEKGIFTSSELHVLKLLSNGKNSKEAAELLNISFHTVNTHRRNMRRKTGVNSTAALVKIARDMGLF